MPCYLVILGAPGAGKGTQAAKISSETGLPHISSGDIFRENLKNQTDLGQLADKFMKKGELVPDDVTIAMIKDRLSREDCAKGAILDGFPRTPAQAKALNSMLKDLEGKVDLVPFIKVKEDVLVKRLTSRWTCREHGHIFNAISNPPKEVGICDLDGSELYQRKDDQVETVENRIKVYAKQTAPLIEYYQNEGILFELDGDLPIDEVAKNLMDLISLKTKESC